MDEGFKQSEKMLNELEAKIHKEYAQASKEMAEKVDKYFAQFESQDAKMQQAVMDKRMSVKEYNEWRVRKMATGKQYIAMRNTLAADLTNTDRIAMKMVNQALPDVYALNMNYGTYKIEMDSKINTSFTLYNHAAVERLIKENPQLLPSPKVDIPKDMRWNQQHINSAITQGILQGKSIPKIAKDLQNVTGMDERAAIRNARTAMTGAQNAGRLDSMKRAAARGVGLKKGWMATLDHVTRDSHVDLDGEVQELDKPFSNGLMYPGGIGEPAEVYNCRCRLTHEYDKYKTDWSNPAIRNTEKLGTMSYQEWKDKHKGKAKKIVPKVAATPILQKVTNKAEAKEALSTMFASVEDKFMKNSETLIVDNTNRLIELNARFGVLDAENNGYITSSASGSAMAWTSSAFRKDAHNVNLSLVYKYYKNPEYLKEQEMKALETFFAMPFEKEQWSVYSVTHEYGHMLESYITRKRTNFDELQEKMSAFNPALQSKEFRNHEKKEAKKILDEIIGIAKTNNPEFSLKDNLSRYGHTNAFEGFAEIFANSQCGAPNELGKAMQEWLVKEGF